MANGFSLPGTVLTVLLVLATIADAVFGPRRFARWLRRSGETGARSRFYRRMIAVQWAAAALVGIVLWTSPELPASDLGFAWPQGGGVDYVLGAVVLLLLAVGCLRARRAMLRGIDIPGRIPGMIPRSAAERVYAAGVSVSAGIGEEILFRGLFLAAGTHLLGLPVPVAAGVSLLLFAGVHRYQGIRGVAGSGLIGLMLTLLYLLSGSLLLPVIVHIVQDLMVLLLIPAVPAPASPPPPVPGDEPEVLPVVSARMAGGSGPLTLRSAVAPAQDGPN